MSPKKKRRRILVPRLLIILKNDYRFRDAIVEILEHNLQRATPSTAPIIVFQYFDKNLQATDWFSFFSAATCTVSPPIVPTTSPSWTCLVSPPIVPNFRCRKESYFLMATHKRTSMIVLSCEKRKRFATFVELLIVIDKRVNKASNSAPCFHLRQGFGGQVAGHGKAATSDRAQKEKTKRSTHSCCLLKAKCKQARSKISPPYFAPWVTKGRLNAGLFYIYA